MSAYFIFGALAVVLIVSLVAFAIDRRDNVRASFSLKPLGFSIEAKDDHENRDNSK